MRNSPLSSTFARRCASIILTTARYRLLDTTRSYARKKLDENDERAALARRHAGYYGQQIRLLIGFSPTTQR
jgi:predicted ATPase